jgi:signal peptide peptidase SppA
MKISPQVLNKFQQTPWSITEEGAINWASTVSYENVPATRAEGTNFMGDSIPTMTIVSGVAIVPVSCAALIHGASALEKGFGAQSHDDISAMLSEAEENPNVTGILLSINCPGGTVVQTPQLAAQIAGLSKPCVAYSDSLCCSAAYWLANAASGGFYVTSCAMTGSVGAIAQVQNIAGLLAASGIEVATFTSGSLKAAGNPYKSMTDAERGHFQGLVNQMGAMFKSDIRKRRPSVADSDLEGQSFLGSDAVARGLADGVVSGMSEAAHKIRQPSDENPWVSDFDRKGKRLPNSASSAQTGLEAEWARSAELRAEFGTFKVFAAFRSAAARGKAVIRQRGDSSTASRPAMQSKQASVSVATAKDYEAQFKASPALQEEFGDVKVYTAFMKASRAGQIKFQRK